LLEFKQQIVGAASRRSRTANCSGSIACAGHRSSAAPARYAAADAFHAIIRMGTRYLQALIDKARRERRADPVAEAYMDYRGVRNGIYYRKIRAAADRLARDPDDIAALEAMAT
jgi:hypothetical protein